MDTQVWLAIITLVGTMFTAWMAYKAASVGQHNAEKIEVVHKATNSLVNRLVDTTKEQAHAAGMKDQKDKETYDRGA